MRINPYNSMEILFTAFRGSIYVSGIITVTDEPGFGTNSDSENNQTVNHP